MLTRSLEERKEVAWSLTGDVTARCGNGRVLGQQHPWKTTTWLVLLSVPWPTLI